MAGAYLNELSQKPSGDHDPVKCMLRMTQPSSPAARLLTSPQPTWVLIMTVPGQSPFIFKILSPRRALSCAGGTNVEMGPTKRLSRNHWSLL